VLPVLLSLILLLALMHSRFRTRQGSFMRAGAFVAAAASGFVYWQGSQTPSAHAIQCLLPRQSTRDPHRCYDPGFAAELSRHLRECKIVPGGSHEIEDAPAYDSRGVSCDYFDQFQNHSQATAKASPNR
jgi:hypothetical protein